MRLLAVSLATSPHTARMLNAVVERGWDVHLFPGLPTTYFIPDFDSKIIIYEHHPKVAPSPPPPTNVMESVPESRFRFRAFRGRVVRSVLPKWAVEAIRTALMITPEVQKTLELAPTPAPASPYESSCYGPLQFRDYGPWTFDDAKNWLTLVNVGLIDQVDHLVNVIKQVQPDILYGGPVQQGAYLILAAKMRFGSGDFPKWLVASWGQDLHYLGRDPEFARATQATLQECDAFTAECARDLDLARQAGFRGTLAGVVPIAGGIDNDAVRDLRQRVVPSQRYTIIVKGYDNVIGRSALALQAIEQCQDILTSYSIRIVLAPPHIVKLTQQIRFRTGLDIEPLPYMSQPEMVQTLSTARCVISLSLTDGISTTALEAMSVGAFPIQSNTGCIGDWAEDGVSCILVEPEDVDGVEAAIRRVIASDELVDQAAVINAHTIATRLDINQVGDDIVRMLERAYYGRSVDEEDLPCVS